MSVAIDRTPEVVHHDTPAPAGRSRRAPHVVLLACGIAAALVYVAAAFGALRWEGYSST